MFLRLLQFKMAPSFDCAASSLLCGEDNSSIFDDADYGAAAEEFETAWHHQNHRSRNQEKSFNGGEFLIGLPVQSDECLALMIEKESQHLPAADYLMRLRSGDLDIGSRQDVVGWIAKAHAHFGFGPLCAYLAINYLDRFLSTYELPKGKAWMAQLLAVACLSLAAKMEENEVPLCLDLQVAESRFVFEARTIQRMELLVLRTLKWRMQAVTPFSFVDYFLRRINDDEFPARTSILLSIQLILSTVKGIDFLEFRPSEIAAAVAISIAGETQTVDIEKAISVVIEPIEKERVLKCIELMHDLSLISGSVKRSSTAASVPSVPHTPIGVLDAACLSYKSDDTTVGSCANSSHNKKRKLNAPPEVEL